MSDEIEFDHVTDQLARIAIGNFAPLDQLADEVLDLLLGQGYRADPGHQDPSQPAQQGVARFRRFFAYLCLIRHDRCSCHRPIPRRRWARWPTP